MSILSCLNESSFGYEKVVSKLSNKRETELLISIVKNIGMKKNFR